MELLRNESITVGTDPIEISQEKGLNTGNRSDIIIINTSTGGQVITLAVDAQAENGKGIVLNVGGSIDFTITGNVFPTQKQITAISNLAGGTISLFERVI